MPNIVGAALVLVAALAWSTAGLFTRVVSTNIPTTLFWRSLAGGLCILAVYRLLNSNTSWRGAFSFSLGEWTTAILSTCGMIFFISAFFYTTIANVSFVYGTMPLVTCLIARLILRVPITPVAISASIISAIGVMLMVWGSQDLSDYVGLFLAFAMTGFMAALTISTKYFPQANLIKTSYLSAFLGAAITAPFASFHDTAGQDYIWLFLYGVVNVGFGFALYLLGVSRISAITAALLSLSEIPLAPIWAWLLFRERVGLETISGGVLIVAAAVLYILLGTEKRADDDGVG